MFRSPRQFALPIIFCIVLGLSQVAFAGDEPWREVTPAELQMKTPKVESDADAEAIFWEVRIDDSSEEKLTQKHYVRVKIFTERGREKYSKFDIPFTKGIKIKDLSARVIKADGTIVEILKTDIFEREIIKAGGIKIKAKSFAVPNIEPGAIVEYRYKQIDDDAGAVGMKLKMQQDVPVQTLSYYYKPYNSKVPDFKSYVDRSMSFSKDKNGYYLASKTNVPSFKEEPRMPPEDVVRPWILLQGSGLTITDVTSMSISFMIKDPSNPAGYWGAYGSERSGIVKMMTKSNNDIKKATADLTASAATQEDKLRKIYEFCQTQVKNWDFDPSITDDAREKISANKTIADVLKRKTGSIGDIDLLFGAMASSLGYETRMAYSGDRSKMFFDPQMTDERLMHRAAVAIKVGEDWKYFNPGIYFLPYGKLVWYEEDVWALLVGEKVFTWSKTPFTDHDGSVYKRTGKLKLSEDGTMEGDIREERSGQPAVIYKLNYYDESPSKREEDFKEELKGRMSTAEVSNIVIENAEDPTKPVVFSYKVRIPSYAQKTGKRLFLQPGFFKYGAGPVFSNTSRKYDVYFNYAWEENDLINITLPTGYTLDSADAPAPLADQQKIGLLQINMAMDNAANMLKYQRRFYFGAGAQTLFPVSAYPVLKQFFDSFQVSDTHTVTLKQM
jgi:hypothetical protein